MSLKITVRRCQGLGLCAVLVLASGCPFEIPTEIPVGDAARGATLFATGDGNGPACQSCHCSDASGGCRLSAPNIQGKAFDVIEARTINPDVAHPGGKFEFTAQDVADLEAFLATVASVG